MEEIPEDMMDLAEEYREKLLDAVPCSMTRSWRCIWRVRRSPPTRSAPPSARPPSPKWCLSPAVPLTATRAFRSCWTPSWTICPPHGCPRHQGCQPRDRRGRGASASDDDEPSAALAFKIMTDPYVGRLCFFRVYSGTLNTGTSVLNCHQGQARAHGPHPADARQPP